MNTSVSALIKAFLVQLTNEGADWERRKRLECEVIASIEAFSAADRLSRDEVNDRRLVYSEHLSAGRDYAGVRVINPFL